MGLDREKAQFRHLARERLRSLLDNREARVWEVNLNEVHREK